MAISNQNIVTVKSKEGEGEHVGDWSLCSSSITIRKDMMTRDLPSSHPRATLTFFHDLFPTMWEDTMEYTSTLNLVPAATRMAINGQSVLGGVLLCPTRSRIAFPCESATRMAELPSALADIVSH